MRALHLLKTSEGAKWGLLQIRELVKLGVDVHVALPGGGRWYDAYEKVGAILHPCQPDLPLKRPWRISGTCRTLKRLVAEVSPDIIHSHFVGTTLAARMALGRHHPVPRVFQIPGPLHLEHLLTRTGELSTAGNADYWMGSCKWTCDRLRRSGVPEDRVFLSYYGVDLDDFRQRQPGKLRRELSLAPDERLVGTVAYMYAPKWYLGQRRAVKGHEDLIDAVAACIRRTPSIRCAFIGGAWKGAERYARRVEAYGRRRCGDRAMFLGNRADVFDLYPDIEVMVHPSFSENVGGALESLLFGRPVVATSVGGLPDVVIPGRTGRLVPPRNPEALAEAILKALAEPERAAEMAEEGQTLVKELFDVRSTSREVLSVYRSILRGRD